MSEALIRHRAAQWQTMREEVASLAAQLEHARRVLAARERDLVVALGLEPDQWIEPSAALPVLNGQRQAVLHFLALGFELDEALRTVGVGRLSWQQALAQDPSLLSL